jgi:cell division protein FtsL
MLKLLLCILCIALTAVMLLELREQRLNLSYLNNQLHNEIEARQAELWNQQLQIAIWTAPNAIQRTAGRQDLKYVAPQTDHANPSSAAE